MPREYTVISPEKILDLSPSDVSLTWASLGLIPATSELKKRQEQLAKEAAAAAGFDLVTITANIHPTTTRGTRRDKPHLTVNFRSTRYSQQTRQTVHINVHVWNPRLNQWVAYQSSKRPDNYPYHMVHQDGNVRFNRPVPRTLAENELATGQTQQQNQKQGNSDGKKPSDSQDYGMRSGSSSSKGKSPASGSGSSTAQFDDAWYPDPWVATSGKSERWFSAGEWTDYTR